jgi:mono/diheme cytochrome c family protein
MVADQHTLPIARDRLPVLAVDAGDAARGYAIFEGNCASCHGAGGANGPDAPRLAGSGLSAGQIAFMVRNPTAIDPASAMPLLGLSDQDVADVSAYVAGLAAQRR